MLIKICDIISKYNSHQLSNLRLGGGHDLKPPQVRYSDTSQISHIKSIHNCTRVSANQPYISTCDNDTSGGHYQGFILPFFFYCSAFLRKPKFEFGVFYAFYCRKPRHLMDHDLITYNRYTVGFFLRNRVFLRTRKFRIQKKRRKIVKLKPWSLLYHFTCANLSLGSA